MYVTTPITTTGANVTLKSPRPHSGTPPNQIQITNNSSYVFGFTTGAEQLFIDPYTRSTYPIATITDSIILVPVFNAYSLVGAGYVAADWLLPNEPPSQSDGALPISQLISQAIQTITSSDGSITVANPNGPTTDLKAQTPLAALGLPPPVNVGSTAQFYTDPLGDLWVAKNGVQGGAWNRARDVLHARWYRNAGGATIGLTPTTTQVVLDLAYRDAYGMSDGSGGINFLTTGAFSITAQVAATPTAAGQYFQTRVYLGTPGSEVYTGVSECHSGTNASMSAPIAFNHVVTNASSHAMLYSIGSNALAILPGYFWTFLGVDYLGTG